MNWFHVAFIAISLSFVATGCHKEDDVGCLGCGIDTNEGEFTFQITGTLKSNCLGDVAPFKTLEFYSIYLQDTLSLLSQTDENGDFKITYTRKLPGAYWFFSTMSSLCILKVKEDSTTFYLRGLKNLDHLSLVLNDSIDLKIYLNIGNKPFTETDILYYGFETYKIPNAKYVYTLKGPVSNHQLINHIQDKWRYIDLDNNEGPGLKMFWKIKHPNGFEISNGFFANATKIPCLIRQDSLIINLP